MQAFRKSLAPFLGFSALAPILALILVSCGQKVEEQEIPATFTALYTETFSQTCVSCHAPGKPAYDDGAKFDLSTKSSAYFGLIQLVSDHDAHIQCNGVRIITQGQPANSMLIGVLDKAYQGSTNFGGQPNCTPAVTHFEAGWITKNELSALKKWVEEGAQDN